METVKWQCFNLKDEIKEQQFKMSVDSWTGSLIFIIYIIDKVTVWGLYTTIFSEYLRALKTLLEVVGYVVSLYPLLCSARGTCLSTVEYDAEGPDELSMVPGDRIIIVGLLVSCFHWFTGRKEATGELGLVKTSLVKPSTDSYELVYNQYYCVSHFNKTHLTLLQ